MKFGMRLALMCGIAMVTPAGAKTEQAVTGPVAEYWVSASTTTGLAGMMGSGGRPSMSALAGMLMHGMRDANVASHHLTLQLGSARTAADPKAEHTPPSGFGAQGDLPLLTPAKVISSSRSSGPPDSVESYRQQRPKGRLLIYWGCGEHAGVGQPYTLDFAALSADPQSASRFASVMQGLAVNPETPPSPSRNATYGEWPNARFASPANPASLVGDHLVQGDYSPDIHFALSPANDFMGGISMSANARTPSGAVNLGWAPVSGAKGILITVVGSGEDGSVVIWSSSQARAAMMAAPQYLNNADIRRFVDSRQLLDGQATTCTVPQEVSQAGGQALFSMTAYGGEVNFSDPPRPANPKTPWNIAWTAKVRYRSSTSGLLGQSARGQGGHGFGLGDLIPHP